MKVDPSETMASYILKIREGFSQEWFTIIPQLESLFLDLFIQEVNDSYNGHVEFMLKADVLAQIAQEIKTAKFELMHWKYCEDCLFNTNEWGLDVGSCGSKDCIDGYKRTKAKLCL